MGFAGDLLAPQLLWFFALGVMGALEAEDDTDTWHVLDLMALNLNMGHLIWMSGMRPHV